MTPEMFSPEFRDFAAVTWPDGAAPPAGVPGGKPCFSVPCPPFGEAQLEYDATFVPTLEDLRQAGGPYAGPPGYYYTIRDDRVVLLPTPS